MTLRKMTLLLGTIAVLFYAAKASQAANVYWNGPATQDTWMNGSYWSSGSLPTAGDLVFIDDDDNPSGGGSVYLDTSTTIQRFTIANSGGSTGNLELRAGTLHCDLNNNTYVGQSGVGVLDILAPATLMTDGLLTIGHNASGNGTINLAGTLTSNDQLHLGRGSKGTLNVASGATATFSSHLYLGYGSAGDGTLNLNGGTVTTNGALVVSENGKALFEHNSGTMNVLRTGSDNAMYIGTQNNTNSDGLYRLHDGLLNVQEGHVVIGNQPNAKGAFEQLGGTFHAGRSVYLGASGTASYQLDGGLLEIVQSLVVAQGGSAATMTQTGGDVTLGQTASDLVAIYVGRTNGSVGTYNISGGTLTATTRQISVGDEPGSTGTINQSGGTVSTAQHIYLGREGTGTYNMSGGLFDVAQVLVVGRNTTGIGTFNQTGGDVEAASMNMAHDGYGEYNISNGTLTLSGDMHIAYQGTSTALMTQSGGTVNVGGATYLGERSDGEYRMSGGTWNNSGLLRIGQESNGAGRLVQSGGDINVNNHVYVGFNGPGEYQISGGTLTTPQAFVVGTHDPGQVIQTGGTVTVNRSTGNDFIIGERSDGTGLWRISGGTLNVANSNSRAYIGQSGPGRLEVLGSDPTINFAGRLQMNAGGALKFGLGETGATTITPGGAVTINTGATIDADPLGGIGVYGVATAYPLTGAGFANLTVADDDGVFALAADGSGAWSATVNPSLTPSLGGAYNSLGTLGVPSDIGRFSIPAVETPLPVGLDLVDATGADLAPDTLLALYDWMTGETRDATIDTLELTTAFEDAAIDLGVTLDPEPGADELVWDFTDFNDLTGLAGSSFAGISQDVFVRGAMVTGPAIPEPSTIFTALLGLVGAVFYIRRRR